jgi:hypothetical protein
MRHIGYVHKLDVEDQVRLRRNSRMIWTIGDIARPIGELPRDEDAPLAADFHSTEAVVEARYDAALALRKWHRLRFGGLGLAVRTELRFAILADDWLRMIFP